MSANTHPFLRFEMVKFQAGSSKQTIDLKKVKTEIEIKDKNQSAQPSRIKKPIYNETNQSIRFDAGLFANIERQIIIRLTAYDILYTYESDLKLLQKLVDGIRHQFNFTPKAQAEMIIEYKDPSAPGDAQATGRMHGHRYAERYQNVFKHFGHRFVAKVFKIPAFCSICRDVLWGFGYKGFQCQRCDCVVHKDCYDRCVHPCTGKKYPDLEVVKRHQFEHQPFSLQTIFCDHDGSFIRPGHSYKCTECSIIVHRRCRSKVGDYCGCRGNTLELYEEWKKKHRNDADYNYQYNEDLCEIYSILDANGRPSDVQEAIKRVAKDDRRYATADLQLNQIQFLRKLGQGMSGKVYLVKRGENYFALKSLCKHLVLEGQNVAYIQEERDILAQCQSNPFIIQLYYSFQNAERLFFLMEVARAGCLYDILEMQAPRPFRHERIVFYTGQVTCALMFLHSKRIIYRDLKPENIFVFDDGNLKLGDFGLSKQNVEKDQKTNTICGTPEYIAYEIYNNDSYDQNVDWWSLGILVFELSNFKTPFYANNSTEITENVLSNEVSFPETTREDVRQIISALLERDPKRRLGNSKSPHGSIRNQPFFKEPYTLEAIETRSVRVPWTPTLLVSLKPSRILPQLSQLDKKDAVLLLSTPEDTFRNFSYINPNARALL